MPLIPRDHGGRVRVEITAEIDPQSVGDWYDLWQTLGHYAREQASAAQGVTVHVPYGRVSSGDLDADDLVPVTLDRQPKVQLQKIRAWLAGWSHRDPITEESLKRLPPSHAKAILAAIEELEQYQWGPPEDSPLRRASNGSSETSSSTRSPSEADDGEETLDRLLPPKKKRG